MCFSIVWVIYILYFLQFEYTFWQPFRLENLKNLKIREHIFIYNYSYTVPAVLTNIV